MIEPVYVVALDTSEEVTERQYAEALIYFVKRGVVPPPINPLDVHTTMMRFPGLQSRLKSDYGRMVALLLGVMTEQHPEYSRFITITNDTYTQRNLEVRIFEGKVPSGSFACVIHVRKMT